MEYNFLYYYPSYRRAANKHLKACKKILSKYDENENIPNTVCIELYYISGYIVECCGIYSIYKHFGKWEEDLPINIKYSAPERTGADYIDHKAIIDDFEYSTGLCYSKTSCHTDKNKYIKGHNYRQYQDYLQTEFIDMPYLGGGLIDEDIRELLNDWNSNIRYCDTSELQISTKTIRELFTVCTNLFNYCIQL